jgi:PEGA domain
VLVLSVLEEESMMGRRIIGTVVLMVGLLVVLTASVGAQEQNKLLGEVQVLGKTKIDKTSGVWVDGQYLGYVQELTGDKKILLLPGSHEITVRQVGYVPQTQTITVEPGKAATINVTMEKDPNAIFPTGPTAQVKLDVTPDRAAVFVDGGYAGTTHEFGGVGKAMIIAPGKHHVKIALAGFQEFNTDISLKAGQKISIKTELVPGSINDAGPAIKSN